MPKKKVTEDDDHYGYADTNAPSDVSNVLDSLALRRKVRFPPKIKRKKKSRKNK